REPAAVRGGRVGPDLLLGRVHDVQVVEVLLRVADERPDGEDVVAPFRRAGDAAREAIERADAAGVRRSPAPDDVLVVEDQEVPAADGEQLRRALLAALGA